MAVYGQYLSKALSNIIMARQAMSTFKTIRQKDYKNGASYHTQQAIELILKYCIYNNVKYNKNNSHVCRHTFCTNMAKRGISVETLKYLMGHTDISVTLNVYTHLKLEDAEKEIKRLENVEKELKRCAR